MIRKLIFKDRIYSALQFETSINGERARYGNEKALDSRELDTKTLHQVIPHLQANPP